MKQQTALQELIEELERMSSLSSHALESNALDKAVQLAKEKLPKERQQIEDAYIAGDDNPIDTADYIRLSKADAANYFTENYEQ